MIAINLSESMATLLCVAIFIYALLDIIGIYLKFKTSKNNEIMRTEWKIGHLLKNGYLVTRLGKNIRADRGEESVQGNVSHVHRQIFGY